ncbi:GNAT family N-acetyltransferase [Puerhibacterium puerhi]|uniref:GNAT family N-acetyltransferase n=1 Tax=Puerhibacterium puerhi TaxID=2692623 RepID=UPI001359C930|nr:GNAT family N-acetyltransferase [Puerhibacterium puerhi]
MTSSPATTTTHDQPAGASAGATTWPLQIRSVHLRDPLVRPLLDELAHEYWTRYRKVLSEEELRHEMDHYGEREFSPPHGELLLLLEGAGEDGADAGHPVAGGAFRHRTEAELGDPARLSRPGTRRDDGAPAVPTAELKRIWTHSAHRRRGLARIVLTELEQRARERGYRRVYLTTGPRQPEAVRLYLATGYTPLFNPSADPGSIGPHAFEKWLVTP